MDPEEKRRRHREASRRYRERHPERSRNAVRRWRTENRERFLASNRKSKKKYYRKNRARLIEWQRDYTKRNYDRLKQGWTAYAASHREEARVRARKWRREHPDRVAATTRRRKEAGYHQRPERRAKAKEWVNKNRDRVRDTLRASRLRRRAQSAGTGISGAEWREILDFWQHTCAYCGAGGALEADHRIPLARGGTSEKANIVPACPACNRRKHTLTEDEFRIYLLTREPFDVPYVVDGKPVIFDTTTSDELVFRCNADRGKNVSQESGS